MITNATQFLIYVKSSLGKKSTPTFLSIQACFFLSLSFFFNIFIGV